MEENEDPAVSKETAIATAIAQLKEGLAALESALLRKVRKLSKEPVYIETEAKTTEPVDEDSASSDEETEE